MKRNKSSPKENTTYRREASSHHGQENRDSRSEYSDDEQYDMTEANRIEKSRSRTDMDDWTNQLWTHLINAIVTVIVCVIFMIVYCQWGQVQPVSTKDNSHESKQPMPMEKVIMDLRNENEKYKTMLDDISSKLMTSDKANRRVDNLNEKFGELEKSFKIFKTMTESNFGMLEEIRRTIDNNSDKLSKNGDRIEQVNTDISNTSIDLERVDNLHEKFGELEKSVKTMTESNTGMLAELRRKIDNNSDKLSKNGDRIEQVNTDISNTRTDLEEKLRQEENNVKKTIQESRQEVSKMLHEMDNKIKEIEGEISSASETFKNAKKSLQDEVDLLRTNAFNKSVMLNLVVFLSIAVFALIISMLIIWNRVSFDHHGNTPRHGSGTNPRMSVIEQVPNHPPLTNTICVISYGQTNEFFNHTLVHKLMRQLSQPLQDTPVRGHLINTHADIVNIPHCKLIFMCVEFSTRHVIIEEPGIGQGDIRRTTYDAVRKLGATLVILYTRDPESRQLGDKLRYQKDIYCVASQPELKVLDDQKCFYSVFTSFTQSQVESLETVIRRALK